MDYLPICFAGLFQDGLSEHQPQNSALSASQQQSTIVADSLNVQQGDSVNSTSTINIQGAQAQSSLQQDSTGVTSQQQSGYSDQNQNLKNMKQQQTLNLGKASTDSPRNIRTSQYQQNSVDYNSSAQYLPDHPLEVRSNQLTQEQKEAFKRHLTLDYCDPDYNKLQALYYKQRQGPVEASTPTLRQYEEPDTQASTQQQNAQKPNNIIQNKEKQQNQEKVQVQDIQKSENSFVNEGDKTIKQQDYIREANNNKANQTHCIVCMDEEANYAIVHGNIGHTCIGQNCKILVDKGQILVCPLCRKKIEGVIQIFG